MIPCEQNVEAFIEWVHAHDAYQVPDLATDILREQEAASGAASSESGDLRKLPRDLILQLRANPNISLGGGYRATVGNRRAGAGMGGKRTSNRFRTQAAHPRTRSRFPIQPQWRYWENTPGLDRLG